VCHRPKAGGIKKLLALEWLSFMTTKWRVTDRSRAAIIFGRCLSRKAWKSGERGLFDQGAAMANPLEFINQVRAEGAKVTWPTRRETLITTGLVLLMVVIASLFFVTVDQLLRLAVTFILSLAH
jgi:preprotein translocase subunit SecE